MWKARKARGGSRHGLGVRLGEGLEEKRGRPR